jgi:hypothetical protein
MVRAADVCAWIRRPHRGAYRGALLAQATARVRYTLAGDDDDDITMPVSYQHVREPPQVYN